MAEEISTFLVPKLEAGFSVFTRRIVQYEIPPAQISTLDDVDFVLIVNHHLNEAKYSNAKRIREAFLEALKSKYFVHIEKVVGTNQDYYLIHLSYLHFGLLAEILQYPWPLKNQATDVSTITQSLKFHCYRNDWNNSPFKCENRTDFSPKLRYDLAYQFLSGTSVVIESQYDEAATPTNFNLKKLFRDQAFDDWIVPHEPWQSNLFEPHFKTKSKVLDSFFKKLNETAGNANDRASSKKNLREFLASYCTLKTAFTKHSYDRDNKERQAAADLWHILPIHLISEYCGETIGFYFAWTELLVMSMAIPAILGACFSLVLALYFSFDVFYNKDNDEFAGKEFSFLNFLQYLLVKTCDNYATPFYALIMILWGTTFREIWIRRQAWYRFFWNVEDLDIDELQNVQSKQNEKRKDNLSRHFRMFVSMLIVLLFIALVFCSVYFINVLHVTTFTMCPVDKSEKVAEKRLLLKLSDLWVPQPPNETEITEQVFNATAEASTAIDTWREYGCSLFKLSPILANSLSIWTLNAVFTYIAHRLTKWENHAKPSQHNNSIVLKLFLFRFFNFYTVLFFTAFSSSIFSSHGCVDEPCLMKLTKQLLGILITQPIFNTINGLVMPSLKSIAESLRSCSERRSFKGRLRQNSARQTMESQTETSLALARELDRQFRQPYLNSLEEQTFTSDEFTERVVLLGALLMFSVAFPPATFLAICILRVDLTMDVRRIVTGYRRPIPQRANGIGQWDQIVNLLTYLSIITNPLIVVLTSTWGSQFDAGLKFWIFIIFEHVTIAIRALVALAIPDVPAKLEREKLRCKLAKQDLMDEL